MAQERGVYARRISVRKPSRSNFLDCRASDVEAA
jgi:hypothetical protein